MKIKTVLITMSEHDNYIPSYLESDKEGYVLVNKRVLIATSHAFAYTVNLLAELVGNDPEAFGNDISDQSRQHAQALSESEVERIISQAINNSQLGL